MFDTWDFGRRSLSSKRVVFATLDLVASATWGLGRRRNGILDRLGYGNVVFAT